MLKRFILVAALIGLAVPAVAASQSPPLTMGGMTLGTLFVESAHPGAQKEPRTTGWFWSWKRPEGGDFAVHTDKNGIITSIDFTADKTKHSGTIDLPCIGNFGIDGSHANLEFAASKPCISGGDGHYELPDHSILIVTFAALESAGGDGPLDEATWYRPAASQ